LATFSPFFAQNRRFFGPLPPPSRKSRKSAEIFVPVPILNPRHHVRNAPGDLTHRPWTCFACQGKLVPQMKTSVTLDGNEWGQIIDGLVCRAELYEETARYHESGYAENEIAEVRDADEARNLAQVYRRIIRTIENAQLSARGIGP
jgi:hypothetical protein